MTTARTEKQAVLFKVSDYEDGTPWISTEPRGAAPGLHDIMIGFDLKNGTTQLEAQRIADYLNEKLSGLSVTFFDER